MWVSETPVHGSVRRLTGCTHAVRSTCSRNWMKAKGLCRHGVCVVHREFSASGCVLCRERRVLVLYKKSFRYVGILPEAFHNVRIQTVCVVFLQ